MKIPKYPSTYKKNPGNDNSSFLFCVKKWLSAVHLPPHTVQTNFCRLLIIRWHANEPIRLNFKIDFNTYIQITAYFAEKNTGFLMPKPIVIPKGYI